MEALTRIRKVGGSLVATIPKTVVEEEGLIEDQLIKITVKKIKKSGFGMFKGMRSFTKEDEFDSHA